MLEWLKRHAWKACKLQKGFRGSNPRLSARRDRIYESKLAYGHGVEQKICTGCLWQNVGIRGNVKQAESESHRESKLAYGHGVEQKICTGCLWQNVGIRGNVKQAESESPSLRKKNGKK